MSNLLSSGPLADEELDELDRYLLDLEDLDDSMDISMLDGFLTAIVCGPRTIMPSEWMRWVWDLENGRQTPNFETRAQAERVLGLILRHMNDIATALHESPADYEPLLMENPNGSDPVPVIDEWCMATEPERDRAPGPEWFAASIASRLQVRRCSASTKKPASRRWSAAACSDCPGPDVPVAGSSSTSGTARAA